MSIEVLLFIVVGALAVAAAVMMLLTENAVYSALFLILNFGCIAFLFLMLDASFLAMVQIAVYAGAIMVLFLFVIMLLGAEKLGTEDVRQFRWLAPAALALALSFLVVVGIAVIAGEVDEREIPPAAATVRIMHLAPGYPETVDFYLNGELAAQNVSFREITRFEAVEPGEYSVSIALAGSDASQAIPLQGGFNVQQSTANTVLIYDEGRLPSVAALQEDLEGTTDQKVFVTVFNAYPLAETVDLIDPGSDFVIEAGEELDVLVSGLALGESSEIQVSDGKMDAAFVDSSNPYRFLMPLHDYEVEGGASNLLILAAEPDGIRSDSLRPAAIPVVTERSPLFGSPKAIGYSLFTRYVLPFQMVAMLLLAAMVGAIVLTHRGEVRPKPGRPTRRKVSRPLTSVIASQTGHDISEGPSLPQLESPQEDTEQPEPAGD